MKTVLAVIGVLAIIVVAALIALNIAARRGMNPFA